MRRSRRRYSRPRPRWPWPSWRVRRAAPAPAGSPTACSAAARRGRAWRRRAPWPALHHRADDPGRELLLADARELALRALARSHRDDLFEDLTTDRRDRRALEDDTAVDVHVVDHVAVHQRVGREVDRGHRVGAEHKAEVSGEADDVVV